MEKFNNFNNVDYKKEQEVDPVIIDVISDLDQSNNLVIKIIKTNPVFLSNFVDICERSEIPLEVFIPDMVDDENIFNETFELVKEYSLIVEDYNSTTNMIEKEEINKKRKTVIKKMKEIFDNL
jgi:hypothetical protein